METNDEQLEQDVMKVIEEYSRLTEQLRSYWDTLTREAIIIAKARDLETYVLDVNSGVNSVGDIIIRKNGQDVDMGELLVLARDKCPEVYRKYQEGLERHSELEVQLKEIRESFT